MKISGIRQIKRTEIKLDIFDEEAYKECSFSLFYYSVLLFFWLKDERWFFDLDLFKEKIIQNYRGLPIDLSVYPEDHGEARIRIIIDNYYKLFFGIKNYKNIIDRHFCHLIIRETSNNNLVCWITITIPENEEKRP